MREFDFEVLDLAVDLSREVRKDPDTSLRVRLCAADIEASIWRLTEARCREFVSPDDDEELDVRSNPARWIWAHPPHVLPISAVLA